jgi:hypothetical protein
MFLHILISVGHYLSRLFPYADEIIGDHQRGFRRNRSTTGHIFYIRQMLEWEYNGTAHKLFTDFKKACDSVRRKALYSILTEFGIPRKLLGLMCLNETYSRVRIDKNLSGKFPVQNDLKQETLYHHCFSTESPKERDHSKDRGVERRTGSEWILRRLSGGGVEWIHLAQGRGRWQPLVNTMMNLWVLAPRS